MLSELLLLALTMFGECRGCSREEMRAVGHVVMNRVRQEHTSVAREALRPGQFVQAKMHVVKHLPPGSPDYKSWIEALRLAENLGLDNTNGATHFKTVTSRVRWPTYRQVARVGPHLFYRKSQHEKH